MADNKTFKDGGGTNYTHALEDLTSVFFTKVVGAAAENAAVAGSPLQMGGRYDATPRTLGDGDAGGMALNVSGQVIVEAAGAAAENAAVSGNPVLSGGRYDSSDRTLGNGDVGAIALTAEGIVKTSARDAAGDAIAPIPQAVFTPRVVTLNFSSNIDVHASGDVVADSEILAAVTPANDVAGVLTSLTVINVADTAVDLRFHFFKANVSLGTESAAVTLSAANAVNHLGYVDVVAADYADLINSQVATIENINLGLQPVSGSDDVYVAIEARGAVDLAATTDLHVTFSFL